MTTPHRQGPQALRLADDSRLIRLAGLALPAAVWVMGIASPPRDGLSPAYVATYSSLLAGLVLVDQTAPPRQGSFARRLLWLVAELALSFLVVSAHGSLIRPALIYLLPASRALLMFGERPGLALSLSVWLAYALNVGQYAWPDRLNEYPNYLSFFLALYVVAVALTLSTLRQAEHRLQLQRLYDELKAAHEQLQALHQQARELAVTQERNRLAREIHDSLAHYLTVINVQLEAAEKLVPHQIAMGLEQVRRARRLAVECLQEVRRSVAALRAATLDELSLPRALKKLAAEFSESTRIPVQLEVAVPDDVRLAPETALALYRAAQEGLTNVQRHARATAVHVSLARDNGSLALTVQDDGLGPTEHGEAENAGLGLLGLRERVELLGGQISFGRGDSGGSRLIITLPGDQAS